MLFTELSINPYILFSRLKTLADATHTAHGRKELAFSMRIIARYCSDDMDRQEMLRIAADVENFTVGSKKELQ